MANTEENANVVEEIYSETTPEEEVLVARVRPLAMETIYKTTRDFDAKLAIQNAKMASLTEKVRALREGDLAAEEAQRKKKAAEDKAFWAQRGWSRSLSRGYNHDELSIVDFMDIRYARTDKVSQEIRDCIARFPFRGIESWGNTHWVYKEHLRDLVWGFAISKHHRDSHGLTRRGFSIMWDYIKKEMLPDRFNDFKVVFNTPPQSTVGLLLPERINYDKLKRFNGQSFTVPELRKLLTAELGLQGDECDEYPFAKNAPFEVTWLMLADRTQELAELIWGPEPAKPTVPTAFDRLIELKRKVAKKSTEIANLERLRAIAQAEADIRADERRKCMTECACGGITA